jgi:ubiquinone/menaquinone biosynthesis C-methylase UbiE
LSNVEYLTADFQHLPFEDDSLDAVFVVESLCHALDMPRALDEVARVLREEGIFVVVDAWRTQEYDGYPEIVKQAAQITERAMAVGDVRRIDEWLLMVERAGFKVLEDRDLTVSVLPNMHRLERAAVKYFRHPRLARLSNYLLPARLVQNSIAALLMPLTVEAGAHTYRLLALKKR